MLWNLHYEQEHTPPAATNDHDANIKTSNPHVLQLPNAEPGLALENEVLEHVKAAWQRIVGAGEGGFMVFGEREGMGMGDDEEGE